MTWTTQPRCNIGGHPAIVAGSGAPVVLLHGVGLRAEAWNTQIDALSPVARVIAPDMPGHGTNTTGVARPDIEAYCDAALSVLEALDGPPLIIGHSMGAMLALGLAHQSPNKVRGVVALNAVFERSETAAEAVEKRAAALDGISQVDPTPALARWFGDAHSAARMACADWLSATDPAAYKRAYTAFATSHVPNRDSLKNLHCPALFMTGALEPNSTPEMSRRMADLAAHGRVEIVSGAAHMMPMTHPDPVNAALKAMFAEVFPTSAAPAPVERI